MAIEIVMPNLGFDTATGRLIEWLKQPGDAVAKGEAIAIVESDKANVELESIAEGVLLAQLCRAGDEVAVGAAIARVGHDTPAPAALTDPEPSPARAQRLSPVAQRIAREHNLDVQALQGSGTGGRIMRRDVERQIQSTPQVTQAVQALPKVRRAARQMGIDLTDVLAAGATNPITMQMLEQFQQASTPHTTTLPAGVHEVPQTRVRRIIGNRLAESMREAPHFYVTAEFDLEQAMQRLESSTGARFNDLLQYLTVQTLLRVPQLNAVYENGKLYRHDAVHLALAVARGDTLITPVIANAQHYSLSGLATVSRELIQRARDNHLHADDLRGGTFTISNLGMVSQVEQFTAVINPPQIAILAVGALKPRPVVRDGGLHIRRTVHLTLSGDHRALDGMDLARFMAIFEEEVQHFVR
jgi:pyruvate dehydrogenase E2 component (dihydrolipoamide acetyltransferase)